MPEGEYDVIVIGGGIAGASSAHHLVDRGQDVLLLERDQPATKATGRSSGDLTVYRSNEPSEAISRYGRKLFDGLAENHETVELHEGTGYHIAHSREGADHLEQRIDDDPYASTLLDAEELAEREPDLNTENVTAAISYESDTHTDPYAVTTAILDEAFANGLELHSDEAVTDLDASGGDIAVQTTDGEYVAPAVVCATGAWSAKLAEKLGLTIPLTARTSQVAIFESSNEVDLPRFITPDIGLYGRQEVNGDILVGGGPSNRISNPDDFSTQARENFLQAIANDVGRISTKLTNSKLKNHYAERNTATPTNEPLIGETRVDGFYMCAGFNGIGVSLAPFAGRLVTDLILDAEPIFDPEPYDPTQFDGTEDIPLKGASTDW